MWESSLKSEKIQNTAKQDRLTAISNGKSRALISTIDNWFRFPKFPKWLSSFLNEKQMMWP